MSDRKRSTMQGGTGGGFIPKSDWVRDETANSGRKEEVLFFHEVPRVRRWRSIIEAEVEIRLERPACEECGEMCADLVEFYWCLSCGWMSEGDE